MSPDLPGKVPSTSPTEGTKRIDPQGEGNQPAQSFESYMQQNEAGPAAKANQPSPFDLPQGRNGGQQMPQPTMDSVQSQFQSTKDQLNTIQDQLNNKNLKLKQSQKYLLNNKLTEANSQIRSAAAKVGVDVPEPKKTTGKQSVVGRYLGLIQDSQDQVDQAAKIIQSRKDKGDSMSPGELLMVQVKIQKANTQLEYSSVLLSTLTSDIKTIFNIQI